MASPSRLPSLRKPPGSSRPFSMIENPMANVPDLSTFTSDLEPAKKSKRRSLLPQFSRMVSADEQDRASSRDSNSGDGNSSRPSDDGRRSVEPIGRRAIDEERRAMPPPATKAARPMSMIPPRGSSQASKLPSARSHARKKSRGQISDSETARAQSLAALTGSAPVPEVSRTVATGVGLRRAGSTRLPQSPRVDGPMIPSRTTSAQVKSPRTKRSSKRTEDPAKHALGGPEEDSTVSRLRLPAMNTSALTEPLMESSVAGSSTMHTSTTSRTRPTSQAYPPTSPPRISSRARPISQLIPPSNKPAFTTYQQHYSPAKSGLPKPPLPSAKPSLKPLPPSAEIDEPLSFETSKLQIELLQLSLLHQASQKTLAEYEASAERKLRKQHMRLRKDYDNLRAAELAQQRSSNLTAMDSWCPDTPLLIENLQILSLVYTDLSALMEEGSRYNDVVSLFELWMNEAENPHLQTFIAPLPDDWQASHDSLLLKLRTIQRNLRVLPPAQKEGEASGLGVMLRTCKALVDDMLKELEVMVKLEREVMAREKAKVEGEVGGMLAGMGKGIAREWKPAWQAV